MVMNAPSRNITHFLFFTTISPFIYFFLGGWGGEWDSMPYTGMPLLSDVPIHGNKLLNFAKEVYYIFLFFSQCISQMLAIIFMVQK